MSDTVRVTPREFRASWARRHLEGIDPETEPYRRSTGAFVGQRTVYEETPWPTVVTAREALRDELEILP